MDPDDLIIDLHNPLVRLGDDTTIKAVFRVPSRTRPDNWHYVIVYKDKRGVQCSCEGGRYRGRCWAIDLVPEEDLVRE